LNKAGKEICYHRRAVVVCRHTGIPCCIPVYSHFFVLKRSTILYRKVTAVSKQLLLVSQYSTLRSNEHDFNCQLHCE